MSVLISFSRSPDDVWMIQNRVYDAFIEQLIANTPGATDAIEELRLSVTFHGLDIDSMRRSNPELANQVCQALRDTASAIANGTMDLRWDHLGDDEFQTRCKERFQELAMRIDNIGLR